MPNQYHNLGWLLITLSNYKVSNKTNTESKEIADAAWNELQQLLWTGKQKPIGLVYSCEGKQLNYIDLTK